MSLYESIIVIFTAMGFILALVKFVVYVIDVFLKRK